MHRWHRFVLSSTVLLVTSFIAIAAEAQNGAATKAAKRPKSAELTYANLSARIAHLLKLKADEQFLAAGSVTDDNKERLRKAYGEASAEVPCPATLVTNSRLADEAAAAAEPEGAVAVRRLLCADINYRIFLIEKKISFWGGARTLVPEIPPVHLRRLRALLTEFEKLAGEVDVAQTRNEATEIELIKMMATRHEARGHDDANTSLREAAVLREDAARARFDQFNSRLEGVREQRALLQQFEARARARQESASAALSQALVSAVSNAVGAPDWVVSVARGDPPEKALRQAAIGFVSSELANNAELRGKLNGALNKLGTSTSELEKLYDDVKKLERDYRRYSEDFKKIGAVLRKPTLDGILEIGTIAFDALPENEKGKWRAKVREAKPILEVASLVTSRPDELSARIRSRLVGYVSTRPEFVEYFRGAARSYVTARAEEASALYGELLRRVTELDLNDAQLRTMADSFIRTSSRWLIAQFRPDDPLHRRAKAELLRALGVNSDIQLEQRLAAEGLRNLPTVRVEGGRVLIKDATGAVLWERDLREMLRQPGEAKIAIISDTAVRELDRLFDQLANREEVLRKTLIDLLPFEQVEAGLRKVVSPGDRAAVDKVTQAWNRIVEENPADSATAVEALAAMQVGSVIAEDQLAGRKRDAGERAGLFGGAPEQSGGNPAEAAARQAMTFALDAMLPGLGTGINLAVSVVSSFADFNDASNWLKDIRNQLNENYAAEARLLDLGQEAKTAQELANKATEVHQRLQQAYRASFETQTFGLGEIADATERNQARMKLRRALTFYLAERLREEFDLLDRAITLWGGIDAAPRGTIAQLIREDPQNVRLALDSEIHLFQMLDRDAEGARTDVDPLLIHWRQLLRLADDACARIGCEAATAAAQMRDSGPIGLCDLIAPEEAARFAEWQRNPKGRFALRFFLGPDRIGPSAEHGNHRIVEVRLGGVSKPKAEPGAACHSQRTTARERLRPGRTPSANAAAEHASFVVLRRATLTHPGVAYVSRNDGLVDRESLLLRRGGSFMVPTAFDLEALRQRWIVSTLPQRRFFEGYSPFTEWELTLEPEAAVRTLEDVVVRIAYQYNDAINIVTEREFLNAHDVKGIDPHTYEISWSAPADRPTLAGRGLSGERVVLRVPEQGNMPGDVTSLSLLSTMRAAISEQRRASVGLPPRSLLIDTGTRCNLSPNGQPSRDICWGLANAEFVVRRICKPKEQLIAEFTERQVQRLLFQEKQMTHAPYDLRRRKAEAEAFRRRRDVDRAVEALRRDNKCDAPEGQLILVGPPPPAPGGGPAPAGVSAVTTGGGVL